MIVPPSTLNRPVDAIAKLTECYRTRGLCNLPSDKPIVGITSNTVPWELLVATGFSPLLLSPNAKATPHADEYMEGVFSPTVRSTLDDLLSGELSFLDRVVIPRTSEEEHKLFLYLREISRQEPERQLPFTYLYNLLQSGTAEAREYSLSRTRDLAEWLGSPSDEEIERAAKQSNLARDAVRALLQVRESRIPGAEILPLIGAFYFMDRQQYSLLAIEAARSLGARPLLSLPRILIKGSPLNHPALHAAIESHGLLVSAEDDWWGSRAVGETVKLSGDPIVALFHEYSTQVPNPRKFPPGAAEEWFRQQLPSVDGVVFYLAHHDDVLGWDYPRQRDYLESQGIPYALIRQDLSVEQPMTETSEAIAGLAARLRN